MVFSKITFSRFPEIVLAGWRNNSLEGWGYDKKYLPHPWAEATYFFMRYINFEGHFSTLFKYHFKLLS